MDTKMDKKIKEYEPVLKIMLATNAGEATATDYVRYDYTLKLESQRLTTDARYPTLRTLDIEVEGDNVTVVIDGKRFPLTRSWLYVVTVGGMITDRESPHSEWTIEREYICVKLGKRVKRKI